MKKIVLLLTLSLTLILPGCGNKNKKLVCTMYTAANDSITIEYEFKDGKATKQTNTFIIPSVENEESYKSLALQLNNYDGCTSTFEKITENKYKLIETCDYSKLSDQNFEKVYATTKKDKMISREQLIKAHEFMKCE